MGGRVCADKYVARLSHPPVFSADARNRNVTPSRGEIEIYDPMIPPGAFAVAPRECRSDLAVFVAYLQERYDGGGELHTALKGGRDDVGSVLLGNPRRY